ncbi:MAG TPA: hypothetical protein VEM36_03340 [Xanthobacteraceae bacterium]|nr:hypothetical protein [Xanthobacteraceae bacterium]
MTRQFSTPLTELPGFLSTISMVVDDGSEIVRSLIAAERKSPPVYDPARDLFCVVLEGKLSFENAMRQARALIDETERACAIEILEASEVFLRKQLPAPVGVFPSKDYHLHNGLTLDVSPLWHRRTAPERLMVLHFWRKPLSDWQLSAAGAVIRTALTYHQPQYLACELDFISVPFPEGGTRRRFDQYNWAKIKPLSDVDLKRFWKQFLAAWTVYHRKEPRVIRRRREPNMFDSLR